MVDAVQSIDANQPAYVPPPPPPPPPAPDPNAWNDALAASGSTGGTPQSLLTEQTGQGDPNCLENASNIAQDGRDEIIFLKDTGSDSPGTGHVVVQNLETGVIRDPSALGGQATAPNLNTYLANVNAINPNSQYSVEGTAPASQVHTILSLPQSQRAAYIAENAPQLARIQNDLFAQPGDIEMGNITPGNLQTAVGLLYAAPIAGGAALSAAGRAALSAGAGILQTGAYTGAVPFIAIAQAAGLISTNGGAQPPSIHAPVKFDLQSALGTSIAGGLGSALTAQTTGGTLSSNIPAAVGRGVIAALTAGLNFGFARDPQFAARATNAAGPLGPTIMNLVRFGTNIGIANAAGKVAELVAQKIQGASPTTTPNPTPAPGPSAGPARRGLLEVAQPPETGQIVSAASDLLDRAMADPDPAAKLTALAKDPQGADRIVSSLTNSAAVQVAGQEGNAQLADLQKNDPAAYKAYIAKASPDEVAVSDAETQIQDANSRALNILSTALQSYNAANPNGTVQDFVNTMPSSVVQSLQTQTNLIGSAINSAANAAIDAQQAWLNANGEQSATGVDGSGTYLSGGVWAHPAIDGAAPKIARPDLLSQSTQYAREIADGDTVQDALGPTTTSDNFAAMQDAMELLGISNRQVALYSKTAAAGGVGDNPAIFGSSNPTPEGTAAYQALIAATQMRGAADADGVSELKTAQNTILTNTSWNRQSTVLPDDFSANGMMTAVQNGVSDSKAYFKPDNVAYSMLFGRTGVFDAIKPVLPFGAPFQSSIESGVAKGRDLLASVEISDQPHLTSGGMPFTPSGKVPTLPSGDPND